MVSLQCIVANSAGLHARPAQELVKLSKSFTSSIRIRTATKEIDAKSIFGVLSAAIKGGTSVEIFAEGDDEESALCAVVNYIAGFRN